MAQLKVPGEPPKQTLFAIWTKTDLGCVCCIPKAKQSSNSYLVLSLWPTISAPTWAFLTSSRQPRSPLWRSRATAAMAIWLKNYKTSYQDIEKAMLQDLKPLWVPCSPSYCNKHIPNLFSSAIESILQKVFAQVGHPVRTILSFREWGKAGQLQLGSKGMHATHSYQAIVGTHRYQTSSSLKLA